MHTDEVINALTFAKTNIETNNILPLTQNLIAILNQNVQPNQPRNPFEDQKSALIDALNAISTNKLTNNERDILKAYNASNLIGNAAADRIISIFVEQGIDTAAALKRVKEFSQQIQGFIQLSEQAISGLSPLKSDKEWDVGENEELLRITFQNDASISNIVNLKEHAASWHEIMRGFSMAADSSPDAVRVISVREGSVILEVAAFSALILAIGKAAKIILEGIEKYYLILQKIEEIKRLKLQNAQIATDLAKEAESYVDIQSEQIAIDVIKECFPKKNDGEVKEAVKRGVKRLFTFLKNGGGLDYQPFDDDHEGSIQPQLQEIFGSIRTIENQINELKYLVSPDSGASNDSDSIDEENASD